MSEFKAITIFVLALCVTVIVCFGYVTIYELEEIRLQHECPIETVEQEGE